MIGDGSDVAAGLVGAWLMIQRIAQLMDLMVISFVGKSYDVVAAVGAAEDFVHRNWDLVK